MNKKKGLTVTFFIFFVLVHVLFMSAEALAALVPVPAGNLLSDALSQNFEGVTVGPITGNDPAFSAINVSNASLVGTFADDGDELDSGFSGNALVSYNSTLTVQAPSGSIDNMNSGGGFRFDLSVPATQFGFVMVDQTNLFTDIEIFYGGQSLGIVTYNPTEGFPLPFVLFESAEPFDAVEIRSNEDAGGWGLDDITLAGFQLTNMNIPTINEWGMIFMSLILAGSAVRMIRRNQQL